MPTTSPRPAARPSLVDLENAEAEELGRGDRRRRRGRLRGRRRARLGRRAQGDDRLRRRRAADRSREASRMPTRYVMISAMSADADHDGEEVFDVYIRAKGRADEELADLRSRVHDRPPRRADGRGAEGPGRDRAGGRARRDPARGRGCGGRRVPCRPEDDRADVRGRLRRGPDRAGPHPLARS